MKRNEELVAENARLRDYLKDVYSKMQKFKEDNGVSIENWDSLVKKEGVDVMNMASFFFLDANIKSFWMNQIRLTHPKKQIRTNKTFSL